MNIDMSMHKYMKLGYAYLCGASFFVLNCEFWLDCADNHIKNSSRCIFTRGKGD